MTTDPGTAPTAEETDRPLVRAGVAQADITPTRTVGMAGFVARLERSTGVHDPLTVRALCIEDTCLVTLDLCGVSEDFCRRVAERCVVPSEAVLVHTIHTHSAAQAIPGHPAEEPDEEWLATVEEACVQTIDRAHADRVPARLFAGSGPLPGITRNRRRPDGPIDDSLPVLEVRDATGAPLAVVISYACHPVVLDAHNTRLSADYPGHLRQAVESARPGAMALFATGCAGDLNTGHSAKPALGEQGAPDRTQAEASRIGTALARAALSAPLTEVSGPCTALSRDTTLSMDVTDDVTARQRAAEWADAHATADDPVQAKIFGIWSDWAQALSARVGPTPTREPWSARVSAVRWGDFALITLPGEPFCTIGTRIRRALPDTTVSMVLGYTGGYAGYIPTADEYPLGGYEPCESHRYRGMPGPFTPGTDDHLVELAVSLAAELDAARP